MLLQKLLPQLLASEQLPLRCNSALTAAATAPSWGTCCLRGGQASCRSWPACAGAGVRNASHHSQQAGPTPGGMSCASEVRFFGIES
jgi:hypothetical protein